MNEKKNIQKPISTNERPDTIRFILSKKKALPFPPVNHVVKLNFSCKRLLKVYQNRSKG